MLNLALEEIDQGLPIQQMSMRKLAKRAGFAHTNVYNFFPSLGHLQWEALGEALHRMEHACFEAIEQVTPRALIQCYVNFALEHPGWYRLIFLDPLDQDSKPTELGFLQSNAVRFYEVMSHFYAHTPDQKIIQISGLLHSYVHGWLVHRISHREAVPMDEASLRLFWADIDALFSLIEKK